MRFRDQWKFVQKNAAKNRSRLFMTVLATAIGCAFLIVLASVGYGIQETIISDITEGRVLNEIAVRGKRGNGRFQSISKADLEFMASLPNVRAVTREQMLAQQPAFRMEGIEGSWSTLVAVDFPSEERGGLALAVGRLPERSDEVLVGFHFVQHLRSVARDTMPEELPLESLIDATLEIQIRQSFAGEWDERWFPVKIVGVVEPPPQEWLRDPRIWISETLLEEIEAFTQTPRAQIIPPEASANDDEPGVAELRDALQDLVSSDERAYENVIVHARNIEDVKGIVEALDEAGYASFSIAQQLERINTIFVVIRAVLVFVGMIAVIIASIGIYNTMTMAVTERAQDIGIMKAIGAHPAVIKRIYLIESAYIGLLGAIIGVLLSFGVSYLLNTFMPAILESVFEVPAAELEGMRFSSIPGTLVLFSVTIAVVVAVVSGLRPAVRATRVDVLQALRRDL